MHAPERCKLRSDVADLLSADSAAAREQHGFLILVHWVDARADIQRTNEPIRRRSLPELLLNTA
jgi:hypothetical protein